MNKRINNFGVFYYENIFYVLSVLFMYTIGSSSLCKKLNKLNQENFHDSKIFENSFNFCVVHTVENSFKRFVRLSALKL